MYGVCAGVCGYARMCAQVYIDVHGCEWVCAGVFGSARVSVSVCVG